VLTLPDIFYVDIMLLNTFILIGALDNHIIKDLVNRVQQTFTELIVHSTIKEVNQPLRFGDGLSGAHMIYTLYYRHVLTRAYAFPLYIDLCKVNWHNNLYILLPSLVMDSANPCLAISEKLLRLLPSSYIARDLVNTINPGGNLTDDQIIAEYKRNYIKYSPHCN
jgi:hypothetical protein